MKIYILNSNELIDEQKFDFYYNKCPQHRKQKIDSKKSDKDRRLSLGSEIALIHGMADNNISENSVSIAENGKPYLLNGKMHFSLSHTGEYSFAVFSDCEIGIDAEKDRLISEKLLTKTFSTKENELLAELDPPTSNKEFLKIWTRKEAFSKASNIPLSSALSNINVLNDKIEKDGRCFSFLTYFMDAYCISVCSESDIKGINIKKITL